MTLQAQLGGDGRDLPLIVGLYDAAGDQRVSVARHSFVQHIIELAKLVAAKSNARGIFALHP